MSRKLQLAALFYHNFIQNKLDELASERPQFFDRYFGFSVSLPVLTVTYLNSRDIFLSFIGQELNIAVSYRVAEKANQFFERIETFGI